MANAFSDYCGSLYNLHSDVDTPQPTTEIISNFLRKLKILKLTPANLQLLNSPFTTPETSKIIESLPNNKSPGPDGFTGEYYKTVKHILSTYMENIYNAAAASSVFPSEML